MALTILQYPTHAIQDGSLSVNTVLGTNANTTSTPAIDLGTNNSPIFPTEGEFTVQIAVSASGNAANNGNVNITLQHSQVNTAANFVNIPELAPFTVVAAGGGGNIINAITRNVILPPNTARYIRLLCVTGVGAGNPNDATATRCSRCFKPRKRLNTRISKPP